MSSEDQCNKAAQPAATTERLNIIDARTIRSEIQNRIADHIDSITRLNTALAHLPRQVLDQRLSELGGLGIYPF